MSNMRIIECKDSAELEKEGVGFVRSRIQESVSERGLAVVALPGGRSVTGLLDALSNAQGIEWKNVHVFLADERVVPVESSESNFRVVKEHLLDNLIQKRTMPKENAHPLILNNGEKIGSVLSDYSREIEKLGGPDLLILSAGEDCHIASLFPHSPELADASPQYLLVENAPKPPSLRVTMPPSMIKSAKSAVLLFVGKHKAEAFARFMRNEAVESCPARLLAGIKDLLVLSFRAGEG